MIKNQNILIFVPNKSKCIDICPQKSKSIDICPFLVDEWMIPLINSYRLCWYIRKNGYSIFFKNRIFSEYSVPPPNIHFECIYGTGVCGRDKLGPSVVKYHKSRKSGGNHVTSQVKSVLYYTVLQYNSITVVNEQRLQQPRVAGYLPVSFTSKSISIFPATSSTSE